MKRSRVPSTSEESDNGSKHFLFLFSFSFSSLVSFSFLSRFSLSFLFFSAHFMSQHLCQRSYLYCTPHSVCLNTKVRAVLDPHVHEEA